MSWKQRVIVIIGISSILGAIQAQAGDLKISVPRRSHMTPVQKLNRAGVDAVRKHVQSQGRSHFL